MNKNKIHLFKKFLMKCRFIGEKNKLRRNYCEAMIKKTVETWNDSEVLSNRFSSSSLFSYHGNRHSGPALSITHAVMASKRSHTWKYSLKMRKDPSSSGLLLCLQHLDIQRRTRFLLEYVFLTSFSKELK